MLAEERTARLKAESRLTEVSCAGCSLVSKCLPAFVPGQAVQWGVWMLC